MRRTTQGWIAPGSPGYTDVIVAHGSGRELYDLAQSGRRTEALCRVCFCDGDPQHTHVGAGEQETIFYVLENKIDVIAFIQRTAGATTQ